MSTRGRGDRHIPVLRDRILDLLAPALAEPARSTSTRRSAWAATPRLSSSAAPTPASSGSTVTRRPWRSRGRLEP